MSYLSVEPRAAWFGSWRFFLACIVALALFAALLGARTKQLQSRVANPVEVHLYGQAQLVPGQSAAFRVFVADGKHAQPLSGAEVRVALIDEKGARIELGGGRTDETGVLLVLHPLAADLPEGAYRLEALASSPLGEAQAEHAITVKRGFRILLTTDKPIYQPGQTISMRALAIDTADGKPAPLRELLFEVQDSKGNKVFKQKRGTSQFGIAAVDFVLAEQVNTGDYELAVYLGGASARRSVAVKTYVLPKFRVDLTSDRASYQPGDILQGELKAIYTFGQPVAGARVRITGSDFIESYHEFTTLEGTTDAAGRYRFSVPVPALLVGQALVRGDAVIKLDATVTATAGGVQEQSREVIVAKEPLRIEAVAESGELTRGVPNRVYLIVSTLEGEPLAAKLTVRGVPGDSAPRELATSRLGVAQLEVTPEANRQELVLEISATSATAQRAEVTRKLPIGERSDGVLLRPEHAVYHTGDSVRLSVLSSGPAGRVFLDVVKEQRTVMTQAIDVKEGRGSLTFELPPDLGGTLELSAYALRKNGEIVRDVRIIKVYAADELQVSLAPEKPSYAPGDKAVINISVSHRDGTGVAAALGLTGVDEAVYALYDTRPGLEQLYFTLQEELLKPRYELHAHLPPPLFGESRGAEVDEAQTVLLSAVRARAATEAWPGPRFVDRQREYDQATQAWFRMLIAAGLLSPIGIFAFLLLCTFVFAVSRLFLDNPIKWESLSSPEDIERVQGELNELTRTTGGLMSGWVVGLILPPIFGVLGQLIGELFSLSWREREQAAVGGVLFAALIVTTLLFRSAILSRRSAIGAQRPLFRKIVLAVPFAYLCGALGCVLSIGAAQRYIIEGEVAMRGCLSAIAVHIVYFGVLSIVRQTALRPVSLIGWLWLLLTRPLLFAIPGVLFLGTAMLAKNAPGMMRQERLALLPSALPSAADSSGAGANPKGGEGSSELVQPTHVRRHFPETLVWRPEVITDDSGKARLEIPLADSITTWRLAATAVTAGGELGGQTIGLPVFQDFFVDLEMPATLTQHDELDVPVSVFNYLGQAQQVKLDLDVGQTRGLVVVGLRSQTLSIGAKQTARGAFRVRALLPGRHTLTVRAKGSALADAVERPVTVLPDGQAVTQTINGRLEPQVVKEIVIPDSAIEGGSDLYLKIYPGSFSQIVEGLDGIFRMPSGCFEQTSSTTYPSVLALDYLRRSKQQKPDLELKALSYIGLGYQRLLSFEVSGGGFEWFGQAPAHNLLTAYGLLEFRDMSRVYEVDPALIERTRRWLWQQNKDGRFTPTSGGIAEGAINQYRNDTLRATAYITWALAEADKQLGGRIGSDLERSLDSIYSDKGDSDAYTLALRAQALLAADRTGQAAKLLDQLEELAVIDSDKEPSKDPNRDLSKDPNKDFIHFTSSSEGVTHSLGDSMDIETTGLAVQALLQGGGHKETAYRALRWLQSKRDASGTWGSTQATIAAMRALLAGTEGGGVKGEVTVTPRVNEAVIPALRITPDTSDVYRLISLRPQVRKGKNTITLFQTGEGDLTYQIVAVHYVPWQNAQKPKKQPQGSEEPMTIAVKYDATTVRKDALLGVHVSVGWNRPGAAPMTLVDLGIPPGFELLSEDLDNLASAKQIERYSNTDRQLLIYLGAVAQDKPVTLDYRLRARYSVRAKTPASRAYPYYQPEAGAKAVPTELVIK